jgi:hypothetical protein
VGQADLRRILGLIGADVVDLELPVGQADTAFEAGGALRGVELDSALNELVGVLRERMERVSAARHVGLTAFSRSESDRVPA